jgi:hypothetical protein
VTAPRVRLGLIALALAAFLLVSACGAAAASKSANWVGVAQTVVVATDSTGKVSETPQVFTQFSANGSGPVSLKVPMSSEGFRNLSSLGTAPIRDGYAVWDLNLSGPTHQRSVAHFPADKLPLKVSAAYELNGKKMKAKDIVGKTGELKVSYVIKNVTTKPTPVAFKNIFGDKQKTTVKAPVPVAAELKVTIPADFTNLKAPSASASGNGNGTSSATWTLFMFKPLGGVKQSVSYQAHVTDAVVPSATVEAAVLPPKNVKPLPSISEPGAPAVPVGTLGARLASLQKKLQGGRAHLATKATSALRANSATAEELSLGAGNASTGLTGASAELGSASAKATEVHDGLRLAAAEAADAANRMAEIRIGLEALPNSVKDTRAYQDVHANAIENEARLTAHADRLELTATAAGELERHLSRLTSLLTGASTAATDVSTKAAEAAGTLANATVTPKESNPIPTRQVGGGTLLDQAVGQLDGAISGAGDKVDNAYAYLTALEKRAGENLLPAGNAQGATAQVGAFVYSVAGANNAAHETHLAAFIAGFALALGLGFGIGLYRIRRGMPSSLKPPKANGKTATRPSQSMPGT